MITETLDYIETYTDGFKPEIGIVLGSGLGELADEYCEFAIPYGKIPGFGKSNVGGHKGQLVFAVINGKKVVMMQGRIHYYEGHSMQDITYPIKVMKKLGVKTLIITNAAGAINKSFRRVYIASSGPSYETPAEIKMARYMGADAAGMSTVPEAIVANYCGMKVIGISCISNFASGVSTKKLTHKEVIETTSKVKAKFKQLILLLLKNI